MCGARLHSTVNIQDLAVVAGYFGKAPASYAWPDRVENKWILSQRRQMHVPT